VVGRSITYDVAANWKVIAENYNECYHCGPVHPELCDLVPSFRKRGGAELDWEHGIPHRPGADTYTLSGTSTRASFPGLNDIEQVNHFGELIYPNLMLSLSRDHVAAFVLRAVAADRTMIDCLVMFHPDEAACQDFDPSDAFDFWHMVNLQDWAICDRVQRGMTSSSFVHGWYAPMEDPSLDIRRWWTARMRG
jgi:Rieske 2Fe-2S family protein